MRSTIRTATTGILFTLLTLPAWADDAAQADDSRDIFNAEVCKIDDLTSAQCDCVWTKVSAKLSPQDLKLAMLLTASNSEDSATAKKADAQLDKSNASDKRRDALLSELGGLVIDSEDACP